MKKAFRYTLWITGGLGCLLILLWLGMAAFVTIRKQTILERARVELKTRLGGESTIGDMDISFLHHFPNITVHLSHISIRDSLWREHHHDLLNADDMYLSLALFRSLFAWKARLGTVYLEKATVYLFTDSTGYSNTSVFNRRGPGQQEEVRPPDISISDTRVVIEKQDRHKFFDLEVRRLKCKLDKQERILTMATDADVLVKSFSFNNEKGSFLKDKVVSGRCKVEFNVASKIVEFNKARVHIDGHPFVLTGRFFPNVKPDPFVLHIQADNIPYRQATALLTPAIQQKLDLYDVDKPVSIQADLDAGSADDHEPSINVRMHLQHASINTPVGRFNEVNAIVSFTNEWVRHEKRRDENSAIRLLSFSGAFMNIPVHSDTAVITNLKQPMLACDLRSSFELSRLNEVLGSKTIYFNHGSCSVNVDYRGPLKENDSSAVSLTGGMTIDSATVVYLPYHFQLTAGTGKIRFRDQDVVFEKLEARAGSSKINLKGIARNVTPLIDQNPAGVGLDFTLSSPRLDLADLAPVLGKPVTETAARKTSKPLFGASAGRLDQLLREGTLHLQIEAAELHYQHFSGVKGRAELLFQGREVLLKNMELAQDDGSISLTGTFRRQAGGGGNPLSFKGHLQEVDLPKLFSAFGNFGQDGLTARNLKGKLTADVAMTGLLTDKARMVKRSMKGSVSFSIKGGQLIDFEPMEKIHEAVLKNRDLSEIRFGELTNQLDLDTTTLNIHRMEIQSTALTLFVEGVYDLKAGPDLSLQVPLSNLKKDRNPNIPPDSRGNDGKAGLSLRLRVRRGDDGRMRINWDPFKKALKKKK